MSPETFSDVNPQLSTFSFQHFELHFCHSQPRESWPRPTNRNQKIWQVEEIWKANIHEIRSSLSKDIQDYTFVKTKARCRGLCCVPPKSPNPQHLRTSPYLESGSLQPELAEMRSFWNGWALNAIWVCPCKKKRHIGKRMEIHARGMISSAESP